MSDPARPLHIWPRSYLAGYMMFVFVALRKIIDHAGRETFPWVCAMLGVILLLYFLETPLLRVKWFNIASMVLQFAIIQTLGWLEPYEDTWSLLYIALAFRVVHFYSRRIVLISMGIMATSAIVTMMFTLGPWIGLGRGLFIVSATAFMLSYDILYSDTERARWESQQILSELQQAHEQLKEHAERAEELAAAQERDRLSRELHDSVSQMIFSITLNAQAAMLLLEKDPAAVRPQLERLQELTSTALGQMRSLISQWHPRS
jgi:signal transduction histidine kinase